MDILKTIRLRQTPQAPAATPGQVRNAAGGYTFPVDDWARVHRFLTLGTDGGTYYTADRELTRDNAEVVLRVAATDPVGLVNRIVEVSEAGRAPKANPALFALAIAASSEDVDGRRAALAALPRVARTATHLFLFAGYVEQFRGWGPTLRRAVSRWYTERPVDALAYQLVKYRQRGGWSHRDMLRLARPSGVVDPARRMAFNWAAGKGLGDYAEAPARLTDVELKVGQRTAVRPPVRAEVVPDELAIIADFEDAQAASAAARWIEIIGRGHGLSWEMLPDAALAQPAVWEALIDRGMPQTALMRQLPRLTRLGVLSGAVGDTVAEQLADRDRLVKARVHPVNVLVAQRTYTRGCGARGQAVWTPVAKISDALDAAFYAAYGAVRPAYKRTLLALDVSGSMGSQVSGLPISCREAAAALAMVTAATEPAHRIIGFTAGRGGHAQRAVSELDISPRRRLDDVCRYTADLPFGATDCALPMMWALRRGVKVDTFHIYTDNETWYGSIHPHQALAEYRHKMGIDARLVVVAMTASGNSIADPADPRQLDISGFDSAVPTLLADFSRGDI
ncbi:TROVE domain-containing protein [Mycolicibacterium smegmatis]|uniref:TROVE domain protein n=2 Tax=Mycolicibacterium smegmatis TaxID=1772 RepID=A0QRP7_MYCS2|nr:TROVE domain-containing protein [Mycolicibacterium smegmatis]ABK75237.1 TROVE domain protein [Mycolicibacterium smegmatis MC2 155]AIU06440.1 RNA-binding protein [Mycolicibacterium smegmatis MC2 155]AIU13065.1 RNA-binding protein [Mycolicibacterium smegmatis]AIU19689.1 RNA-binding protein [Mycolicibacterium smegmatis]MBE9618453.1 TROVE domain-containing protein [Mycolicibacterium smegmatis]